MLQLEVGRKKSKKKIYRKSVLHLLKYRFAVYLSISVQICGTFWNTQYVYNGTVEKHSHKKIIFTWFGGYSVTPKAGDSKVPL